jgi:hypothetical protein
VPLIRLTPNLLIMIFLFIYPRYLAIFSRCSIIVFRGAFETYIPEKRGSGKMRVEISVKQIEHMGWIKYEGK